MVELFNTLLAQYDTVLVLTVLKNYLTFVNIG